MQIQKMRDEYNRKINRPQTNYGSMHRSKEYQYNDDHLKGITKGNIEKNSIVNIGHKTAQGNAGLERYLALAMESFGNDVFYFEIVFVNVIPVKNVIFSKWFALQERLFAY